jgi:hypothetical protein
MATSRRRCWWWPTARSMLQCLNQTPTRRDACLASKNNVPMPKQMILIHRQTMPMRRKTMPIRQQTMPTHGRTMLMREHIMPMHRQKMPTHQNNLPSRWNVPPGYGNRQRPEETWMSNLAVGLWCSAAQILIRAARQHRPTNCWRILSRSDAGN